MPNQKINIIWHDNHLDTGREISNIIHLQQPKRKKPYPDTKYIVYRYGKRLECPPYTAKEIDKRVQEQQGREGLFWYVTQGYNIKPVSRT